MTNLCLNLWVQPLNQLNQLWLGYSGGLDSQVLLHRLYQMPELRAKLRAIHINHGLNLQASEWQEHCEAECRERSIPLHSVAVKLDSSANIEQQARTLRYRVFSELLGENDGLLLAHHRDDQAETLLLQLARGSGIDGMSGMLACRTFVKGKLIRPLLEYTRADLHAYACAEGLRWVHDNSNEEKRFARNFVRHDVLPLLKKKWPGVTACLARSALNHQQAKSCLSDLAQIDAVSVIDVQSRVFLPALLQLSKHRQVNVLRHWISSQSYRLPSRVKFEQMLQQVTSARADANPCISWDRVSIRRYRQCLYLVDEFQQSTPPTVAWNLNQDLTLNDYRFSVSSKREIDNRVDAFIIPPGSACSIRFAVPGATINLNGKNKRLKKCFQTWAVPPWQREKTPLFYVDGRLAAVIGYAVSDEFKRAVAKTEGVYISVKKL